MKTWHKANMGNDFQGLVIDDESGANIAVTYDVRDAALVAEAPAMLEALRDLANQAALANDIQHGGGEVGPNVWAALYQYTNEARAILARIEEGSK